MLVETREYLVGDNVATVKFCQSFQFVGMNNSQTEHSTEAEKTTQVSIRLRQSAQHYGALHGLGHGDLAVPVLTAVEPLPVTLLAIEVQTASILWAEVLSSSTGRLLGLVLLRAVTVGGGATFSSQTAVLHILAQSLTLQGERGGEAGTDQPEQN